MDITRCRVLVLSLFLRTIVAKVRLINHGYEGVVVSIGSHVHEDEILLRNLQHYLSNTSATLFRATRNRIYYREFIIVIPRNWKTKPHYKSAADADIEHAQIIIEKPNSAYGDAPYVKQYADCGQPGLYIHLTPDYLLNESITFKWGLPGKTLVHEWGHLRWGLFDEYPIDAVDSPFYRHEGKWEPVRCTAEVDGVLKSAGNKGDCPFDMYSGKPGPGCRFHPQMKHNQAVASVMFMQYLESIIEFCDDPQTSPIPLQHNHFAPNRQNRLCSYRSAWEVMRKHEDFKHGNPPLPSFTDTKPVFRFVQVKPRRRVLVLDTSGSMTGSSLKILKQAASSYIFNNVETGSWLGIVQFNTEALILSPLVEIKSKADRYMLVKRLPVRAEGKTSIGAGLGKGLRVLLASKSGTGGTLILITDGKENKSPWIKDIKADLLKNNIMVHALAYGQQAEAAIAQLARQTDGRTFFFSGKENSTSLTDGLEATSGQRGEVPVTVATEVYMLSKDNPITDRFHIDTTIGKDTTVTFFYSHPIEVTVHGPGINLTKKRNPRLFRDDVTAGILTISIPGQTKKGKWKYVINTSNPHATVSAHVQSKRKDRATDVLRVVAWSSTDTFKYDPKKSFKIFAVVSKGRSSVLGVKVVALIERPNSSPTEIRLRDDGSGSDIIKNDGVYTAYILSSDLSGGGRYNIKVKVKGENESVKVAVRGGLSGALERGSTVQPKVAEPYQAEDFERVTSAGEFRVLGFPTFGEPVLDQIPPSRVVDLVVLEFDQDKRLAALEWTAVGDDMDRGVAAKYFLHFSRDFYAVLHNSSRAEEITEKLIHTGTLLKPKPAGEKERLVVNVTMLKEKETLFLSVRAADSDGNLADVSNIVSLSLVHDVSVPHEKTYGRSSYLTIVMPPLISFLLLLVLITFVCIVWASRKHRLGRQRKTHHYDDRSPSSFFIDFPNMNYKVEGSYVRRWQEESDTWSVK